MPELTLSGDRGAPAARIAASACAIIDMIQKHTPPPKMKAPPTNGGLRWVTDLPSASAFRLALSCELHESGRWA